MRRAAILLAVAGLLVGAPAAAATVTVTVTDDAFGPTSVTVPLGTTVHWVNQGNHTHTSTSDQGFWSSPDLVHGSIFDRAFRSSGTFAYHCVHHDTMHGRVAVLLKVTGSPATGWTVRWSTTTAPAGRAFDVQVHRQGVPGWRDLHVSTRAATLFFNPARAGTYVLRARTTNTTTGQESGWSPPATKRIT